MARQFGVGMPLFRFPFPTGETEVEIIPEAAKLNVNTAPPEALLRLMEAIGVPAGQAFQVVEAIVDWRTAKPVSPLDQFYMAQTPSFHAPHASFEQIEELLLVRGMTPELFYGTYERDAAGRLVPRGGLRDCLSVYGAADRFDANFVHPAMLASLGMPPDMIRAIVERRRIAPFRNIAELNAFTQGATSGMERLRVGGNSIYTLRATARLRLQNGQLSDQRRTVAAMVKFMPPGYDATYHILRWYDTAWRN